MPNNDKDIKKNLLIFTSTFPRWLGDKTPADFVYCLAQEMSKFYSTNVLAPHHPDAATHETMESITVFRFPFFWPKSKQILANGKGMLANIRQSLLAKIQIPFLILSGMIAFVRTLRKTKASIVNSHWLVPQGLISAFFKKRYGYFHAITIHAADVFLLARIPFGKLLTRFIVDNTDIFLPVSRKNQEILESLAPNKKIRSEILPMGVSIQFFDSSENVAPEELGIDVTKKNALFVGKITEKKGLPYLIRAFTDWSKTESNARLIIVGDGFMRSQCEEEANQLNVADKINFVGMKSKTEVRNYLKNSDLLVVPSIIDSLGETEGAPVVVMEAMAAGKPIIASDVGGISDMVSDNLNGIIVQPKDVTALTEAFKTIYYENSLQTMGKKSFEIIQDYDWKSIGEKYKNAFSNSSFTSKPQ
ncbi:MAG: glycosyltransferase [Nitrospina sp.]|nr:glycosyltransferase [Nitrospina sp.]